MQRVLIGIMAAALMALAALTCTAPAGKQPAGMLKSDQSAAGLGGTSWQLVKFQSGDGTILTAKDPSQYTLAFMADGQLSVRIACNRGHGTWKSAAPSQLAFGPLALTRAMCPDDPLQDRLVRDWPFVRSYVLKDGHLFVSLMADGGIYDFQPAP